MLFNLYGHLTFSYDNTNLVVLIQNNLKLYILAKKLYNYRLNSILQGKIGLCDDKIIEKKLLSLEYSCKQKSIFFFFTKIFK